MKEYFAKFLEYWKEGLALVAAPALIGVILCQDKRIRTLKQELREERRDHVDSIIENNMWEMMYNIEHDNNGKLKKK